MNQLSLSQLDLGVDGDSEKEATDLSEEVQGRLQKIFLAIVWKKWRQKQQHKEQVDSEGLQNAQELLTTLSKKKALAQWKQASAVRRNAAIAEKTYSNSLCARTFGKWAGKMISR